MLIVAIPGFYLHGVLPYVGRQAEHVTGMRNNACKSATSLERMFSSKREVVQTRKQVIRDAALSL